MYSQQRREALEGVVCEISADAEVVEAKALVAGSALELADPVVGLTLACCAAGAQAGDDGRLCLGSR
jgi:hypothetical protein